MMKMSLFYSASRREKLSKDPKIQAKLKGVPFTYQPKDPNRVKAPIRRLVKERLYCDESFWPEEMDYMREHPEDLQWLKGHVRPGGNL
ncbi:hypothetical protein TOPH_07717 [Tolypocladium ophioglossoides CBS 100239]|uniref:Uncharacterized protein n=1 Tax=Tolypocladium ophioglossoides (strain CBS 100239) TaxID=1163406 RepID=A0A0L0N0F8_TOLOC|nr:hypothetical protein TOPH_07717 [Tolypocladium ophioglossoides CBS 100239]